MAKVQVDGVHLCAEAFQRLKDGKPRIPAHVGLPKSKVTAGIVSVEAGFDRGYLKKSRPTHMPLIAAIEAYRLEGESASVTSVVKAKRAQMKADKAVSELEQVRSQLYAVLAQNIQLVERVRELEGELRRARDTSSIHQRSGRR
ncbi:hypothetical protein ACSQ5K_09380 [Pseudomonas sp. PhalM4]